MKRELPRYVAWINGAGKNPDGTRKKYLTFKRVGWPTRRFKCQGHLSPAFQAEYASILNGTARQTYAFLVKGLVASYYGSDRFADLKPRTQADYRKYLDRFSTNAGALDVKGIKRKHVIVWRDQLRKSDGPHYANYFVRVLRILFEYAIDIDEIPQGGNPAKGVSAIRYDKKTPKPWPKDKIEAARQARGTSDRTHLLFELLYCTGQRIGDVLRMRWTDIRGDVICVRQSKTGADLVVPLTDDLQDCLRAAERRGETILTAPGKVTPWSYRGAAQRMQQLRKEIGAEEHTIHAIRHTVASEIAAAGGTDDEGMAITGHKSRAMYAHYSAAARQEARAKAAQKRRK